VDSAGDSAANAGDFFSRVHDDLMARRFRSRRRQLSVSAFGMQRRSVQRERLAQRIAFGFQLDSMTVMDDSVQDRVRHVLMALELRMNPRAVRQHDLARRTRGSRLPDPPLQFHIVQMLRLSQLTPAARTAHRYFETAPCDRASARPTSRADNLLDSNWMTCLSLGIGSRGLGIGREIPAWLMETGILIADAIDSHRIL
jgi:hypothetical protein